MRQYQGHLPSNPPLAGLVPPPRRNPHPARRSPTCTESPSAHRQARLHAIAIILGAKISSGWYAAPVSKIAARLGVSDVEQAELCRRAAIPIPGRLKIRGTNAPTPARPREGRRPE
jgi:hypothetical protein